MNGVLSTDCAAGLATDGIVTPETELLGIDTVGFAPWVHAGRLATTVRKCGSTGGAAEPPVICAIAPGQRTNGSSVASAVDPDGTSQVRYLASKTPRPEPDWAQ